MTACWYCGSHRRDFFNLQSELDAAPKVTPISSVRLKFISQKLGRKILLIHFESNVHSINKDSKITFFSFESVFESEALVLERIFSDDGHIQRIEKNMSIRCHHGIKKDSSSVGSAHLNENPGSATYFSFFNSVSFSTIWGW